MEDRKSTLSKIDALIILAGCIGGAIFAGIFVIILDKLLGNS
jgi:hypothetical protein